jgi:hypothetical protein
MTAPRVSQAALVALVLAACGGDRGRPGPVAPPGTAILTARLLTPAQGQAVPTLQDIAVRVEARDLGPQLLQGVGFVARRLGGGSPTLDSVVVRFPSRSDTTHEFTLRVPDTLPTNTQVDIYGIAFAAGGGTQVSEPVHVVVVQCPGGICD